MSLLNRLNNRCITNNFLKGDTGPEGPAGPPGEIPFYTIQSNESSTNSWTFDLSVLPSIIRTSNGVEDKNISFSYNFIICETATTLSPSLTIPTSGVINWTNAPNDYLFSNTSLNLLGSNIDINNTTPSYVTESDSYATGSLLGKRTNISNTTNSQTIMFYYIDSVVFSDYELSPANMCSFQTKLNSFNTSSSIITKNAFTTFNIDINGTGTPILNKYLTLCLTPTFLFTTG